MIVCPTFSQFRLTPVASLLVLAVALPVFATAQLRKAQSAISVKAQYGIDVNTDNPNRKNNFLYGLHISYDKGLAHLDNDWAKLINAQRISFGLTWHNLTSMNEWVADVAYPGGQAFGALAEVDIQLVRLGNAQLLFTPGMGLAYITENIFTQPATSTVGSHLNLMLTGELGLEVPLSQNTSVVAAGNILHYSNGGVIVPNGGWNMLTGSLGIKTALNKSTEASQSQKAYPHIERNNAEIWFGAGVRGRYRDRREKFFRSGAYAGYNFYINKALSLKAGSHLVYYHTVFDPNRFDETFQYYGSSLDPIRWGIAAGADLSMGRFVVNAMYGKYLHYRNYHNVKWYWIYGVRYFLTPNIGIQSTLNLHGVQADYTNWGLILRI